jgi:hypothetical protein
MAGARIGLGVGRGVILGAGAPVCVAALGDGAIGCVAEVPSAAVLPGVGAVPTVGVRLVAAGARVGAAAVGPGVGAARAAGGEAVLSTSAPTATRSDNRMPPD